MPKCKVVPDELHVVSLNAQSLTDLFTRLALECQFILYKVHIAGLQETRGQRKKVYMSLNIFSLFLVRVLRASLAAKFGFLRTFLLALKTVEMFIFVNQILCC